MVAVASARSGSLVSPRRADWAWTAAAAGVVLLGLIVRLAVGGSGVGQRSAMVMTVLLAVAAWLAARMLSGRRAALAVCIVFVAVLDIAALPARDTAEYDDLQAFYRTDQAISATPAVPAGSDLAVAMLAQPVFSGSQPQFALAGDVNGTSLSWACPFQHGIQRLALPVPASALSQGSANVQLRLTGSPSRDGDYLVAYASSRMGGFDIAVQPVAGLDANVTRCTLA